MRLIDADNTSKVFLKLMKLPGDYCGPSDIKISIDAVFSVLGQVPDADPVKHGHWIHVDELPSGDYFKCSECNHHIFLKFGWNVSFESPAAEYRYCSLCGAKMDQDTGGDNNGSGEAKKE